MVSKDYDPDVETEQALFFILKEHGFSENPCAGYTLNSKYLFLWTKYEISYLDLDTEEILPFKQRFSRIDKPIISNIWCGSFPEKIAVQLTKDDQEAVLIVWNMVLQGELSSYDVSKDA